MSLLLQSMIALYFNNDMEIINKYKLLASVTLAVPTVNKTMRLNAVFP